MSLAPIGSATLRTRRSILSPGRWVKPSSAPSSWSFLAIDQAMLNSLATPRISPFFPVNSPIRPPLSTGILPDLFHPGRVDRDVTLT